MKFICVLYCQCSRNGTLPRGYEGENYIADLGLDIHKLISFKLTNDRCQSTLNFDISLIDLDLHSRLQFCEKTVFVLVFSSIYDSVLVKFSVLSPVVVVVVCFKAFSVAHLVFMGDNLIWAIVFKPFQ